MIETEEKDQNILKAQFKKESFENKWNMYVIVPNMLLVVFIIRCVICLNLLLLLPSLARSSCKRDVSSQWGFLIGINNNNLENTLLIDFWNPFMHITWTEYFFLHYLHWIILVRIHSQPILQTWTWTDLLIFNVACND